MTEHSVLETSRLLLRPLELSDTLAIQKTAGAREIADTMISLPHPYPAGGAERYVALQQADRDAGRSVTFTIKQKAEEEFCEVRDIDRTHSQGELSFWLAVEAWGQGFMSEVVQAVVQYGFVSLELNRLYAYHMLRNPASGHVLGKNGFKQEGLLRQRVRKCGQFEDVLLWAILQQEWQDTLDK
ncbi:MAG: GNAT family N-acetyltransferase [Candidatus Thiodiazotropha sp. (ex Ustalcina ferruginea)]|nr:GNAT family N-acetyltransferase [Candidatus Thiodiazotropha sp. (ex Ustalcina ferruginea)]